ncbi:hypothetical protein SCHPADRAFT_896416, partial [Schizopora paradoxa]
TSSAFESLTSVAQEFKDNKGNFPAYKLPKGITQKKMGVFFGKDVKVGVGGIVQIPTDRATWGYGLDTLSGEESTPSTTQDTKARLIVPHPSVFNKRNPMPEAPPQIIPVSDPPALPSRVVLRLRNVDSQGKAGAIKPNSLVDEHETDSIDGTETLRRGKRERKQTVPFGQESEASQNGSTRARKRARTSENEVTEPLANDDIEATSTQLDVEVVDAPSQRKGKARATTADDADYLRSLIVDPGATKQDTYRMAIEQCGLRLSTTTLPETPGYMDRVALGCGSPTPFEEKSEEEQDLFVALQYWAVINKFCHDNLAHAKRVLAAYETLPSDDGLA